MSLFRKKVVIDTASFEKHCKVVDGCLDEVRQREGSYQLSGLFAGWHKKVYTSFESMTNMLNVEATAPQQLDNDQSDPMQVGVCMKHFLKEDMLKKLVVTCMPNKPEHSRTTMLRCFALLMTTVDAPLLVHDAVLTPLHYLLMDANKLQLTDDQVDLFVEIAHSACAGLARSPQLLSFFIVMEPDAELRASDTALSPSSLFSFSGYSTDTPAQSVCSSRSSSPTFEGQSKARVPTCAFPMFSALLPRMATPGTTGRKCRDALIACLQLTRNYDFVVEFVAKSSQFFPHIAEAMIELFRKLPSKLQVDSATPSSPTWRLYDATYDSASRDFVDFSYFLEQVANVSSPKIRQGVCRWVYQRFLLPVLCPELHTRADDELIVALAVYDACLNTIVHPALVCEFINIAVSTSYAATTDQRPIPTVDMLLQRFEDKGAVGLATMRIFLTLVELYCEDVMYKLCLEELVIVNQSRIPLSACVPASPTPNAVGLPTPQSPVPTIVTAAPTTAAVSPAQKQWQLYVKYTSAARTLLELRDATFDSPAERTFDHTLENARAELAVGVQATSRWTSTYSSESLAISIANLANARNTETPTRDRSESVASFTPPALSSGGIFSRMKNKLMRGTSNMGGQPRFIACVLSRLERMMEQKTPANLLITAIVSRLCLYPLPLLRNALLGDPLATDSQLKSPLIESLSVVAKSINELQLEDGFLAVLQSIRRVPHAKPAASSSSPQHSAMQPSPGNSTALQSKQSSISSFVHGNSGTKPPDTPVSISSGLWDSAGDDIAALTLVSELHVLPPSPGSESTTDVIVRSESWVPIDDQSQAPETPTSVSSPSLLNRFKSLRSRFPSGSKDGKATSSPELVSNPPVQAAPVPVSVVTPRSGGLETTATELDKRRKDRHARLARAVLLYEEFLKELSAAYLEQAVLPVV